MWSACLADPGGTVWDAFADWFREQGRDELAEVVPQVRGRVPFKVDPDERQHRPTVAYVWFGWTTDRRPPAFPHWIPLDSFRRLTAGQLLDTADPDTRHRFYPSPQLAMADLLRATVPHFATQT